MTQLVQQAAHILAHTTLSMATASLAEFIFPKFEPGKPALMLITESFAQLIISSWVAGEVITKLSPNGPGYISPIGDGFAVYFLMEYQPGMRDKLHKVIADIISKDASFVTGGNKVSRQPGKYAGANLV